MRIRLSEEDAARLGCPRDLSFNYDKFMGRDLLELEEQVGWAVNDLEQALQGVPALNALGGPIFEMDGDKPKLDPAGNPIVTRTYSTKTLMVMVWMSVRRHSPAVAWKDFDFDVVTAELGAEEEAEEQGKGSTSARSKRSTTSTRRRSRASSA